MVVAMYRLKSLEINHRCRSSLVKLQFLLSDRSHPQDWLYQLLLLPEKAKTETLMLL